MARTCSRKGLDRASYVVDWQSGLARAEALRLHMEIHVILQSAAISGCKIPRRACMPENWKYPVGARRGRLRTGRAWRQQGRRPQHGKGSLTKSRRAAKQHLLWHLLTPSFAKGFYECTLNETQKLLYPEIGYLVTFGCNKPFAASINQLRLEHDGA